jgi:threonine dehydrogenase-like Zn-dependent dehydrogenase
MPREIVAVEGGAAFRFREYTLPLLGPTEVRVRTLFAAPKHGTELHSLSGSAMDSKRWDADLRMFVPREEPPPPANRERAIGNMLVGEVTEVGAEVTRFAVGDRAFTYGSVREEHQAPEERWQPLGDLSVVDAVCTDPAHVAFVAVRDGNIRIGDTVAVFGLGAIGLLTVQIARASGARRVYAVDPFRLRREHAEAHGADQAFDPTAEDVGLAIKRATGSAGVDVSLETSGNGRALHEAIRCIRQCGTVVHVPWGPKSLVDLHLDEEFHVNRPTLIGSQAVWNNPDRDHPRWTEARAREASTTLFREGIVTGEGIVTPILPFPEAPTALADLFAHPEQTIKIGVQFS